jgi:hypothetical protein
MIDEHDATRLGHETTDAEIGPLIKFAVFLAVTTTVCALIVVGLYKYLDRRETAEKAGRYPLAADVARTLPPPPRLQTYPFYDLKDLRGDENRVLEQYGWVNKNAGIVRIPIERAIDVLAQKGLPYRIAEPSGSGAGEPLTPIGLTPRAARPDAKGGAR